jgi:hypothetical protein
MTELLEEEMDEPAMEPASCGCRCSSSPPVPRRCASSAVEAAVARVEEEVDGEDDGVDDADEVEGDDSERDEAADGGD